MTSKVFLYRRKWRHTVEINSKHSAGAGRSHLSHLELETSPGTLWMVYIYCVASVLVPSCQCSVQIISSVYSLQLHQVRQHSVSTPSVCATQQSASEEKLGFPSNGADQILHISVLQDLVFQSPARRRHIYHFAIPWISQYMFQCVENFQQKKKSNFWPHSWSLCPSPTGRTPAGHQPVRSPSLVGRTQRTR